MKRVIHRIPLQFGLCVSFIAILLFVVQIGEADDLNISINPAISNVLAHNLEASVGNVPRNCRYGTAVFTSEDYDLLDELSLGWLIDFRINHGYTIPPGIEYSPMIRFLPVIVDGEFALDDYVVTTQPFTDEPGGLGPVIAANPGQLWIVGNEVDRLGVQDSLPPSAYAIAYHDAYHFIKERDPSAQVATSGLVEVTPGRIQYLDLVWESYIERYGVTMPVDAWTMHIYILPERKHPSEIDPDDPNDIHSSAAVALGTDPEVAIYSSGGDPDICPLENVYCYAEHDDMDIFMEQVVRMRQWMKDRGHQDKPLLLTEYSLLWPFLDFDDPINPTTCFLQDEFGGCFTAPRVTQFMNATLDYLKNESDPDLGFPADGYRLVQQWIWYALYDGREGGVTYWLAEPDGESLSPIGEVYRDNIAAEPLVRNLVTDGVSHPTGITTDTVSVPLSVRIRNSGNTAVTQPYSVTFYNEANNAVIDSVVMAGDLGGCARPEETASVIWNDLGPGLHRYRVEVDSGGLIDESDETDNSETGFVLINPEQAFLPILRND